MLAVTEVNDNTVKVSKISVTQVSAVRVGRRRMLAMPSPSAAPSAESVPYRHSERPVSCA